MALGREWWLKKWNLKRKEKWVMPLLHMFIEKTSFTIKLLWNSSQGFFTLSMAFSIASVIPALLKSFIAISLSSLRVLYRSTIHCACGSLITQILRETLTSATVKIDLSETITRRLVSQNWLVTLTVEVKKKTSTLTFTRLKLTRVFFHR